MGRIICVATALLLFAAGALGQQLGPEYNAKGIRTEYDNPLETPLAENELVWCTVSAEEKRKCFEWAQNINRYRAQFGSAISSYTPYGGGFDQRQQQNSRPKLEFSIRCHQANDKDQCMNLIANERAHLVTLDPGEIFIGGRYYSLIPIVAERYGPQKENGYYSVAVVRRVSGPYIQTPFDLRHKRACFPGVGQMGGWVLPMSHLLDTDTLLIKDCNNMIKNAASFFNQSCAPNALIDKHNPTGDNPTSMCALCRGRCGGSDPYSNYDGALRCLVEEGDVAFLKHTTIEMTLRHLSHTGRQTNVPFSKQDLELLCPMQGRAAVDNYASCNWGFVPAHAVVTLSSVPPHRRLKIQNFLIENANLFGNPYFRTFGGSGGSRYGSSAFNRTNYGGNFRNTNEAYPGLSEVFNTTFSLFGDIPNQVGGSSSSSSGHQRSVNLLFSDDTSTLVPINEHKQTFSGYLGSYVQFFDKLKKCTVPQARFCVTSEKEMEKCNRMRTAFKAQMLKPEISCMQAHDTIACMENIRDGDADLTMLDAGDIVRAGANFNLVPIVAERYNLEDNSYFVVAVARQSDKDTDLLYLKGKRSCHTGYGQAAGWIVPLSFLLSNGRMRDYGACDSAKSASQFFEKSCAPGSLSSRFVTSGAWDYGNLCDLCHGSSYSFCARDSSEPFYGNTGAMRCLVEGGGEIAFMRHMTVLENSAGRNPAFWSRNVIPDDFELLCRDGTRATYNEYRRCNLGRVASNALVTHAKRPREHIEAYINLFLLAQQFYGSHYSEAFTFKMFQSEQRYPDLIFSDATSQLVAVPEHLRYYRSYVGHDFLKSFSLVDCSPAGRPVLSTLVTLIAPLLLLFTIF